jgi:hypothetical protein
MHEKREPHRGTPWTVAARSVAGISESARLQRWRVRGSRCGPCVAHGRPAARRIVCGAAWGQGGRERHGPGAWTRTPVAWIGRRRIPCSAFRGRLGRRPRVGFAFLCHLRRAAAGSLRDRGPRRVAGVASPPRALSSHDDRCPAKLSANQALTAQRGRTDYRGESHRGHAPRARVDEGSAGQRLDNFLLRELKGVPKTHVYRVIRSGEVRVNKGRAAADTRLALGDEVRVPPVRLAERSRAGGRCPRPARSSRCCSRTSTCWPSTSRPAWRCTAAAA